MHFLLKFVHDEVILHSKHARQQRLCALVRYLLQWVDFRHVQNHVVEVINQVEAEELFEERVFDLGEKVDIALLAVPSF